ncbi:unnamed protein product [Euphydryas editha]|uniref:CRAL-TRIO domain-containing protein n=1 Tax=Euphydryas editha TaxID=104508 RepID=A0AAU9U8E7_EUPED|nr:unnamed protein product [Euphydryas editha]
MLGDIWIFDLQNVTIGHVLRININLIQKFVNIIQDGIGFKMYEVHVINAPAVGQTIFSLFKQIVKPKIFERFMFHENIDELHKYIPKAYLPKDYGGEEPSLDEFKEMYTKELRKGSTRDYLIACCEQVSNEKLRPGDCNEEYLVGTFKKLEVD